MLWIAREGLRAPLPKDWRPCKTEGKEVYYFNFATQESTWSHPCDAKYKGMYAEDRAKKLDRLKREASTSSPPLAAGQGARGAGAVDAPAPAAAAAGAATEGKTATASSSTPASAPGAEHASAGTSASARADELADADKAHQARSTPPSPLLPLSFALAALSLP